MLRRSLLFLPGNNPGMLQNASILGADGVIMDLEDAVNINEKDAARILVREAMKTVPLNNCEIIVRVNPMESCFWEDDIREIVPLKPHALLLAKADEKSIKKTSSLIDSIEKEEGIEKGTIKIIALIESAYGVENVHSIINSSDRVNGVLFGAEDYTADLGIKRTKAGEEIFYARNKIATACKAKRISAIDTPFTDTEDLEGLLKDTLKGKSLGMTGKASINPRQIELIHEAYAPSKEEVNYALRVLKAVEKAEKEGLGVFSLDGKMVDAPIIARAQNTLSLAKVLGLI